MFQKKCAWSHPLRGFCSTFLFAYTLTLLPILSPIFLSACLCMWKSKNNVATASDILLLGAYYVSLLSQLQKEENLLTHAPDGKYVWNTLCIRKSFNAATINITVLLLSLIEEIFFPYVLNTCIAPTNIVNYPLFVFEIDQLVYIS